MRLQELRFHKNPSALADISTKSYAAITAVNKPAERTPEEQESIVFAGQVLKHANDIRVAMMSEEMSAEERFKQVQTSLIEMRKTYIAARGNQQIDTDYTPLKTVLGFSTRMARIAVEAINIDNSSLTLSKTDGVPGLSGHSFEAEVTTYATMIDDMPVTDVKDQLSNSIFHRAQKLNAFLSSPIYTDEKRFYEAYSTLQELRDLFQDNAGFMQEATPRGSLNVNVIEMAKRMAATAVLKIDDENPQVEGRKLIDKYIPKVG